MPRDRQQPQCQCGGRGETVYRDRQTGNGATVRLPVCLYAWHRPRYGERGRETLEKQTTVRGVVVFLGQTERDRQTRRDRSTDRDTDGQKTESWKCRSRRVSPDKRDRPLTISHLSVGMDDATGLLGGEVVEIGAPVRVRHGPDRIARLPLPSSGGDCESATQHRHSGERPLESEVWTRTDAVSSWRKMTPGRGIQEKDRGRQALTSGCGAGCGCGAGACVFGLLVDEKTGSRMWNTDGNPKSRSALVKTRRARCF